MRITVNAGHCPRIDSGACGIYSQEANIARDVAEIVCEDLRLVNVDALFVQLDDLYDICETSDDNNSSVFVSIHCNSCDNPNAEGTETFYCKGSKQGVILAKCLQYQLVTTMESVDRGVKPDSVLYKNGLYVLRHTQAPAALCELDFISNPEREDYMNAHLEEMAHAISRGITDYLQKISE